MPLFSIFFEIISPLMGGTFPTASPAILVF
jgi:hypothetical protein